MSYFDTVNAVLQVHFLHLVCSCTGMCILEPFPSFLVNFEIHILEPIPSFFINLAEATGPAG